MSINQSIFKLHMIIQTDNVLFPTCGIATPLFGQFALTKEGGASSLDLVKIDLVIQ